MNKRKITTSLEIPSKKRRDSNKGAENNIFNIITCDIWKIIFQFIYISVNCDDNSNVFKNIRFTCKLFKQLSLQFWNQKLSKDKLEAYFDQENTLEYVHQITVDGVFINLKRKESEIYWEGFSKACEIGFLPIIKKMIKDVADVNQVNPVNCQTPLMYASRFGNLEIVQILLQNGANIDHKGMYGKTPLMQACRYEYLDIVKLLLQNGANIHEKDDHNETSIFYACRVGNLEIVKFLLENGANINETDDLNETPLFYASQHRHLELVQFLIQNGAK